MPWDPEQYLKFQQERRAPFEDLYRLIRVRPGLSVVDLGCGTGELARELARRLPGSRVTGIDSSPAMLAKAQAQPLAGVDFRQGTVEEVAGSWDLVFSHAALHWTDDHETLIPRLFGLVRPGGQLAVQVPANHKSPSHTCIHATAGEEPFRTALGGWSRQSPVLEIDRYATLLYECGGTEIVVLERAYLHVMPDADAVAEWTAGTTLVPYFERLPAALHEPFMASYREKLRAAYPARPLPFTFRRIHFVAARPDKA
jgi:trans-aconitate 2-methyltransferase